MRLNLNFKDANIVKVSDNEFKIYFDMSTLNKPRLSQDARLYIEHFNLPEFLDEKMGRNKGELYGYFELRCDNITDGTDWDSEYGQSGSVILYQSPLNNFATFTNNDPMFIRNFKINQNFFTNQLTFTLKIYDRFGQPFTFSTYVDYEIDETKSGYTNYITKVEQFKNLNADKLELIKKQEEANDNYKQNKIDYEISENEFSEASVLLNNKLNEFINKETKTAADITDKIKAEIIRDIIVSDSAGLIIYFVEQYIKIKGVDGTRPYSELYSFINEYYKKYINNLNKELQLLQSRILLTEIASNNPFVFHKIETEYEPNNVLMKPVGLVTVDYEVIVPLLTPKTGTLNIRCFNSIEHKQTVATISNIIPTVGDDHVLEKNDVLIIDESQLSNILPNTFKYAFSKLDSNNPDNVLVNGAVSASRFSLHISRENTKYNVKIDPEFESKGFSVGTTITINGSALGGQDGVNDLKITIDSIIEYLERYDYVIPSFTDPRYDDHGNFDIVIQRDNIDLTKIKQAAKYKILSKNTNTTKNYSHGDTIVINGTRLGGLDEVNDLTLQVDNVKKAEKVKTLQGESDSIHSIPKTVIKDLVVKDSSDVVKTNAKNYNIDVTSENEKYVVAVSSTNSSVGFATGDYIDVKGSSLTGVDGTNNLRIYIDNADVTTGKILSVTALSTSKARTPDSFKLKVTTKINDTAYYIELLEPSDIKQYLKGDFFTISGDLIGGATSTNDAVATITDIVDGKIIISTTGTAVSETGNIGEIVDISIKKGVAFKNTNIKEIKDSDISISGTPVELDKLQKAELKVRLLEEPTYSMRYLDNLLTTKYNEIALAKDSLTYKGREIFLNLNNQLEKLKCMNMSLVLYDEVPEYVSSSGHSITGNTYSRLNGCQTKRI